ncbi:flagellar hook-associatied protein FlgK [Bacillus sp. TS-2]|nr:flagellar hook-associatied protein FlgK [Bacillus sp. TS-2]
MLSTFQGLETARRALMTQQQALYTTGHNLANANTAGYTRQRVNFATTEAFPSAGMNSPYIPGYIGTGVKAGSIQRVRDSFLDVQFRNENNKTGYWNERYLAFEKMESIMNEPSEHNLNKQLDNFWSSFQDLMANPAEAGERTVVREQGQALADTFNYIYSSLTQIREDYENQMEVSMKDLNSLFSQLNNVNKQIREAEPHGYVTNDLYDEQDRLLDQISQHVKISTERVESSGQPNAVAEGAVSVYIVDANGEKTLVVDGENSNSRQEISYEFNDDGFVSGINIGDTFVEYGDMPSGAIKGLAEAFGFRDGEGIYPEMLASLDEMVTQFATRLNEIHQLGFTLPDVNGDVEQGGLFFEFDPSNPAATLKVSNEIIENLDKIAAAGVNKDALVNKEEYERLYNEALETGNFDELIEFLGDDNQFIVGAPKAFPGDAKNAGLLADVKKMMLNFTGKSATVESFYQSLIGKMAVDTKESQNMLDNSTRLKLNVDYNRQSVSNVSLDEEMTMLIQFQHAYNAAARNITVVDEMLDIIVNRMGLVGR